MPEQVAGSVARICREALPGGRSIPVNRWHESGEPPEARWNRVAFLRLDTTQWLSDARGWRIGSVNGTVLVVDDEPRIGALLSRALRSEGIEATCCEHPELALELLKEQPKAQCKAMYSAKNRCQEWVPRRAHE
jgi:hypothetical protein